MLFSIISAVLLILAFPKPNLSFLAFIGLVPLLLTIQNKPPKKAFLISYVSGFLFYLGVLYWLYHVSVAGLVVLCLYLALYFGIFGFVFSAARSLFGTGCVIFTAPLTWTALEYIQSNLFGGFGWASLGYSQYRNIPFIQIADFSGVYGVSFTIVVVNVTAWILIRTVALHRRDRIAMPGRKNKPYALCTMPYAILILVLVYGYGFLSLARGQSGIDAVKISVVQGNIPQELKWMPGAARDIMDRYTNLTRMAAFDNPDLIIWPETSFPGFFGTDREFTDEVLGLAKQLKIPLLLGANTERGPKDFNSAVLISRNGEVIGRYDKIHLVPFGEYVPFSAKIPILHQLVLGELGEFTPGRELTVFRLALAKDIGFGVLICFEDIFPNLARKFVKKGARFLVVITNDAWYGNSGAPYQHAACSVFRAIENRIPLVRCANTGYSSFIDSRGRIYDLVEKGGAHLFVAGYKTASIRF